MYTPVDKAHFHAWAILKGRHSLPPEQQAIMAWITSQYGVVALNFVLETKETSKGPQQNLVHVILETVEHVKRLHRDRSATAAIADRFLTHYKSAFPGVTIKYTPLKNLESRILNEIVEDEKRAVLETFESVWTMSVNVVFYYTDQQLKENSANGISKKVNEELERVSRNYGFDPAPPYSFDSKESFDRDYEGKWHYYWK